MIVISEEFANALFQHVGRAAAIKTAISGEESTKQSLITPFLAVLGYDVWDPRQIRMEYVVDGFKDKKTKDKVDFAIFDSHDPLFFIEAKSIDESLSGHGLQLSRYFNMTPSVKFAILTNGLRFQFFTDNFIENIMDSEPFYEINIESMSKLDIDFLSLFTKSRFSVKQLKGLSKSLEFIPQSSEVLRSPALYGRPKMLDVQRLTVTIDRSTFEQFQNFTKKNNVNRSQVVRDLIHRWLQDVGGNLT